MTTRPTLGTGMLRGEALRLGIRPRTLYELRNIAANWSKSAEDSAASRTPLRANPD